MKLLEKMKLIVLSEKKRFIILIMIEALLLLACIINLFGHNRIFEYEVYPEMEEINDIELPMGTYRIQVGYEAQGNYEGFINLHDERFGESIISVSGEYFFEGVGQTDFECWIYRHSDTITAQIDRGEKAIEILSFKIVETNALARMILFVYLFLAIATNCIILGIAYWKKYGVNKEQIITAVSLLVLVVLIMIPLMINYTLSGADLIYHSLRVEGIRDSILAGCFPNRIAPGWVQEHGYASPIYYGETLLYIQAIFRLIGFDVPTSYRMFMAVISVLSVATAYISFKGITKSRLAATISSYVYCLSFYRFYKTHALGAQGECFAILSLPLILMGYYLIFTEETDSPKYKFRFIPLTIGMSLLLQSHLLTTEQVGLYSIAICLLLCKKTFRKKTLLEISKAALSTALLSAWYLVPFVEYWLKENVFIQNASARTIQEMGVYIVHHLVNFYGGSNVTAFFQTGLKGSGASGLGIMPIIVIGLFLFLLINKRLSDISIQEKHAALFILAIGGAGFIFSLKIFPWDWLQSLSPVTAMLISSIQFPNRFLTISNVCVAALTGFLIKGIRKENRKIKYGIIYGILIILTLSHLYYTNIYIQHAEGIRIHNPETMGSGYVSGGEYVPYGIDINTLYRHWPEYDYDNLGIEDYSHKAASASMKVVNLSDVPQNIIVDLLYYHNYSATLDDSEIECFAADNGEIEIVIPANGNGQLEIKYVVPWYWRVAELISLISFIGIIFIWIKSLKYREYSEESVEMTEMIRFLGDVEDAGESYKKKYRLAIWGLGLIASIIPILYPFISSGEGVVNLLSKIQYLAMNFGDVWPLRAVLTETTLSAGDAAYMLQSDIVYVIPALLVRIGIPVTISYKLFQVLIQIVTSVIAWRYFGKISKILGNPNSKYVSVVYLFWMMNISRLASLYVSEEPEIAIGMAVLPIFICGIVEIPGVKKSSIFNLTLGLWLLGLTSLRMYFVAAFIVIGTAIVTCISTKQVNKMINLVESVMMSLIMNLWVILPYLEKLRDKNNLSILVPESFQSKGMYLCHYFQLFFDNGSSFDFWNGKMNGTVAVGPGLGLIGFVLICLSLYIGKKNKVNNVMKIMLIQIIACIVLSLNIFPYGLIENTGVLSSLLFASIGSPVIWSMFATVMLCVVPMFLNDKWKYLTEATMLLAIVPAGIWMWLLFNTGSRINIEVANTINYGVYESVGISGLADKCAVLLSIVGLVGMIGYWFVTKKGRKETNDR